MFIDDSLPYGKMNMMVSLMTSLIIRICQNLEEILLKIHLSYEIPTIITGTTNGYTDDYNEACPWDESGAPDVVYHSRHQNINIDVIMCSNGNEYDTKVYVYENNVGNLANTVNGTSACNDDFCTNDFTQYASFIHGVIFNPREHLLYLL